MQKVPFQRGSIVSPAYLNEIQKSIEFTATPRNNLYGPPTNNEQLSWEIGKRDGIKDWEIDPRAVLGRHAHSGRVMGNNGPFVTYGPPATTRFLPLRDSETQEFLGLDADNQLPAGSYGVVVESGSMVSPQGDAWTWGREYFVVDPIQTLYCIFHGIEQQVMLLPEVPSRSLPFSLLSKIEIDPQGILTVTDLRPNTHTDNLFTYRQALTNTEILDEDYTPVVWQRVMADTRYGNLIINLPLGEDAADADEIAIVDVYNTFDENPIIIRPPVGVLLQNSAEDIIISQKGAIVELYYHQEFNSWRFKSGIPLYKQYIPGEFIKCGGEITGQHTLPEECPSGDALPVCPQLDLSLGTYLYDPDTLKCNKLVATTTAIYAAAAPGEYNFEPFSFRCGGSITQLRDWIGCCEDPELPPDPEPDPEPEPEPDPEPEPEPEPVCPWED